MSRSLYVLFAVLLMSAPVPGANAEKTKTAPITGAGSITSNASLGMVAWDAPAHAIFFNYQRYLLTLSLAAQTKETWDKLTPAEQDKLLKETKEFLRDKLAKVMSSDRVNGDDKSLVKAVWGEEVETALGRVAAARELGDQAQIDKATAQAASLAKKVGGVDADWAALFDGAGPDTKDHLAVPKKNDFVDSLGSPETAKILATQKSYAAFLRDKGVADAAMPGMLAMYQVLSGPPTASSREMAHLLPTVVTFLNDGKKISYNPRADTDALGTATPGDYDRPELVELTPAVMSADPVVVGKTLAHEFQHIYDMYTGRYYTLDSEMRGFKVATLYFKTLKERNPEKYQSLVKSDDDDTRGLMRDIESYTRDFDASPVAFREAVATRYQKRHEGGFFGRMSLRESVDPRLESGAVVELATDRSRLEVAKREVAALEADQARLRREFTTSPASRDAARELEKVTRDLSAERRRRDSLDGQVTIKQIRLKRMESELAWMDRNAAKKGRQPDTHDLTLAVDRSYIPQ